MEARPLAAQDPDHLAGVTVDLVNRGSASRRDQQRPIALWLDRVDVEVVEPRAVLNRLVRVLDPHVVEAVPLVQQQPGLDVDLLHDRVEHDPVSRAADRREVPADRLLRRDEGGVLGGDEELVQVGVQTAGGADHVDHPVGRVVDHVLADPDAAAHEALPPGQHRLAVKRLHSHVRWRVVSPQRLEPDQVAVRVEDLGPDLKRPGLRAKEDVAWRGLAMSRDLYGRRRDVRTRMELPDVARSPWSRRPADRRHAWSGRRYVEVPGSGVLAVDVEVRADRDRLAWRERARRQEAPTVAV